MLCIKNWKLKKTHKAFNKNHKVKKLLPKKWGEKWKKIFLVGLVLCIFSVCAIFRTRDVTISNNSDHNAYVSVGEFRWNGDLHGSTGGSDYIELLPNTLFVFSLLHVLTNL